MKNKLLSEQLISVTPQPGISASDLFYMEAKYVEKEPKVMKIKEWLKKMASNKRIFISPGVYTREYDHSIIIPPKPMFTIE